MIPASPIPVYVVDDDTGLRAELIEFLEAAGHPATGFASGEALLAAADGLAPGCVLLDLALPGLDGVGTQRALAGRRHAVVMLSGQATVPAAVSTLTAGAVTFLEKPASPAALLDAVASAAARLAATAERTAAAARLATLTPREREVLGAVADGLPNKIVAHRLGISIRTVETYRADALAKLGARNAAEAARVLAAAQASAGG